MKTFARARWPSATSQQLPGNGSPSATVPTRQVSSDAGRLCAHGGSETFDVTPCDEVLSFSVDGGEISTMLGEVLDNGFVDDFGGAGVPEAGEQPDGLDIVNEDSHWSGSGGGHFGRASLVMECNTVTHRWQMSSE